MTCTCSRALATGVAALAGAMSAFSACTSPNPQTAPASHVALPPGGGDSGAGSSSGTPPDSGQPVNPCIEAGTCTPPVSCSGLSSVVGTWQNISPPAFLSPSNMETLSVVVNPEDETVYAAAGNVTNGGSQATGVMKSSDCGATWTVVSASTGDGANLFTGDPWAMLIDPVNPQTMYINNGYGTEPTIYKSTDGAAHWTALNPDPAHVVATSGFPFVQAIAIDPFNDQHLAVTFHENCASPYNVWCFSQSSDGGNTWQEFNGPTSVPGFTVSGWVESASISILGATSYVVLSPSGVYYTGDGGSTWTLVLAEIDTTTYSGATHILPDGTLYIGDSAGNIYYSSPASGETPPFAIYQAPTLPVPQPRLPYQTGLAPAVMPLTNSPQGTAIVDDGVNVYTSTATSPPFWKAPLSNTTSWTQMPDTICNGSVCRGSSEMAYDATHHVIYSANWGSGLWRLVTR
jgi:hypothetical protein